MSRFASLVCAAALLGAGVATAEAPAAASRTFVLIIAFDRWYLVGSEGPTGHLVQRDTSYRVHITPKADDTATAAFYTRQGQLMAVVRGVVEPRTAKASTDIPADPHSKIPYAIRTFEGKTWLAIGGPGQRQILFQLFDPPGAREL